MPDDLMLDALTRLGDTQLKKMTETRLLSTYVIPVFDPPSPSPASSSWSRAVARTMLNLIQFGGLNYDRLYTRLYRLLDDSLLSCPYADRFLIDLDVYLSSLHLPAATVAAFTKRLAQLSIEAPLWMLPALLTLPLTGDPFDWKADDFNMTGALKSSLWEIACLEQHYHPEVVTLAKRIRQLGGCTPDFLPDLKNQILMGKEISETAKLFAGRSLSILLATNARLPPLPTLDGWIDSSHVDDTKTQ
ncbi:unnamed protein product [Dibothriocephalus latus]|uniref:CCAAT-binding factor domain-containing protein n=1 Tax=Dibothriocephalus latus TaxID=60516 RepID=A0A3P7LUW2_DIBLA|nr:unnamed protein product [Dibothriocephalus latus]